MATTNPGVGISPVLLQAITHTLSTKPNTSQHLLQQGTQNTPQFILSSGDQKSQVIKLENAVISPQYVQNLSNPVTSLPTSESGETIVIVQQPVDSANGEVTTEQILNNETAEASQVILNQYIPQENNTVVETNMEHDAQETPVSTNVESVSMGSVLSAIASHYKSNQQIKEEQIDTPVQISNVETVQTVPVSDNEVAVSTSSISEVPIETEQAAETVAVQQSPDEIPANQRQFNFKFETPSGTTILITPEQIMNSQNSGGILRLGDSENETEYVQTLNGAEYSAANSNLLYKTVQSFNQQNTDNVSQENYEPCPICGDRISGYHYGIFSCESCKGFFKRTVQNKKAFICHRKGECDINMASRKKCPACRFKRCIVAGMKLEAIRQDRQRGGRSSYDGCSPQHRPKIPIKKPSTPRPPKRPLDGETPSTSNAPLVPHTPPVLDDLMAVEALMADEEGEQSCCQNRLVLGDENIFGSVLHFADHCLYKIVRWARNVPEFASVSTDDQILLLQNCWGELLCISTSWHSTTTSDQLVLAYNRRVDMEMARTMGLADIVQRLLDFTNHLKRLGVDKYEFVALKVLLLLTPDVKRLKDEAEVRAHQEKIQDALMLYTGTHYPDKPNKFGDMVTRLAELARTCHMAKEALKVRQENGQVPQYSLLSELLKGDIVVQM